MGDRAARRRGRGGRRLRDRARRHLGGRRARPPAAARQLERRPRARAPVLERERREPRSRRAAHGRGCAQRGRAQRAAPDHLERRGGSVLERREPRADALVERQVRGRILVHRAASQRRLRMRRDLLGGRGGRGRLPRRARLLDPGDLGERRALGGQARQERDPQQQQRVERNARQHRARGAAPTGLEPQGRGAHLGASSRWRVATAMRRAPALRASPSRSRISP